MLIPVNVNLSGPSSSPSQARSRRLPPQLVQFGTDELVLIELQGALEIEGNKDGQLVGKLQVDSAAKKSSLMIGHHLLEGKLVNLPKPLAVLHRREQQLAEESNEALMDVDALDHPSEAGGKGRSWDVIAVVKRKMVFSKRPMPVVGKGASGAPLSRIGNASKT